MAEPARGVVSALVTPFTADGRVDTARLADLVEFQLAAGVNGLFVLGTSGEGLLLGVEERTGCAEAVLDLVGSRVPVVVHCGAVDTATAVTLARHAGQAGASALATLPPLFFPYNDRAHLAHFAAVAAAAPDTDHYVYENPERVGFTLGPGLVLQMIREIPNLRGIKDTGDSLARITSYLAQPEPPTVYTGNNVLLLGALVMGAAGAVSTLANAVPELFAALIAAHRDGRLDQARELQLTVARLQAMLAGLPYIASVKYLLERRGLPGGSPRAPIPSLTPAQRAQLDGRLAACASVRDWLRPVDRVS